MLGSIRLVKVRMIKGRYVCYLHSEGSGYSEESGSVVGVYYSVETI